MVDSDAQTISLNMSLFFLTLVVAFATVCSLSISVLALPPSTAFIGVLIDVIFIVLIFVSAIIAYIRFKRDFLFFQSQSCLGKKEDQRGINSMMNIGKRIFAFWNKHFIIGIILIFFFGSLIICYIISTAFSLTADSVLATVLGFIAIAISLIALAESMKTDELVSSLADLNFDGKMASISTYIRELMLTTDVSISINLLFRLRYDLSAITRIQSQLSSEQKDVLKDSIIEQHVKIIIRDKDNNPNTHPEEKNHINEIKKSMVTIFGEEILK